MLDDRKLEVSFTNRLVDSDLADTTLLYVQLQNRFVEVILNEIAKDERTVNSKFYLVIRITFRFR